MNTFTAALVAITAFSNAFVAWAAMERRKWPLELALKVQDELNKHTPAGVTNAAILSDAYKREIAESERAV